MKFKKYLSTVFVLLLGILLGITINNYRYRHYSDLNEVIKLIENYSYYFDDEEITRQILVEGALKGMVDRLDDPHSVYLDEKALRTFMEAINANFAGIGVVIAQTGDYSVIIDVITNSPAEEAKLPSGELFRLQKGDVLIAVDGKSVIGLSNSEISTLIRGAVGTERTITFRRGDDEYTVIVQLDHVKIPTVYLEVFQYSGKRVGYMKITNFASNTFEAFLDALHDLKEDNVTDLIIDVRNNPGGRLDAVMNMLDRLTDEDSPLLHMQSRKGQSTPFYQNRYEKDTNFDLYVLINGNSASASEVFAAALNELEDVPLIGQQTYGKGTVQELIPIDNKQNRAVKLTTSNWLTPNQQSIQGVGVAPTIQVDDQNPFALIDYNLQVTVDTVNLKAIPLQVFLNRTKTIEYSVREDGYIDNNTIEAIKSFQRKLMDEGILIDDETELGTLNFKTIYHMNLKVLEIMEKSIYDAPYQKALQLIAQKK